MDIFDKKDIKPMLIGESGEAFDSPDYIYELKLDGIRCLAYIDKDSIELRNKRNLLVSSIYPELKDIYKQVKKKCILDGEIIIIKDGKPNFQEIQRRALMSNKFRIELASSKYPVSFVAYDILYYSNQQVIHKRLMERKILLEKTIKENERLSISRYIEEKGIDLYNLTVEENLEGIVAKQKNSKYYFDKKTKDWVKIKNLKDDDYVVCGYIEKLSNVVSIILGQYREAELIYKGHVTLGINKEEFNIIANTKKIKVPKFNAPKNENAIWIEPKLVITVSFMEKMESGSLRQPVFKGLRNDKSANECVEKRV